MSKPNFDPYKQAVSEPTRRGLGCVYLVGAGPGDPKLLTLRGLECLQRAEVVLYDYLVNPRLLRYAPETAERHCLGRHGHSRLWTQEEINQQLVELSRAGKTVVRLKGGDPAVFARGAEEAEELARHGIPFEIVPGITAALAASSYAGIPITHRDWASAVALVTGQEDGTKSGSALDLHALAEFPGTLVFYMGVTTARHWCRELIAAGKSAQTPVAIIRRCSFPDQLTMHCTLEAVPAALERLRPPAIVVVGEVTRLAERLSWFERRPLFGQRILVTRPADQADELGNPLGELGADVLEQPAIMIGPPPDWAPVDRILERLADFDWLVFSSSNGVNYFGRRLWESGRDWRALGRAQLAVIGPGTAAALARLGLRADRQPPAYRAEALADSLAPEAAGQRFLLLRASRGREVLAERLAAAGGHVEQVVAYESRDVTDVDPEILRRFEERRIDWVSVTSSAIARSLVRMYGERLRQPPCKLASISPVTSATLRELGFEPAVEAREFTTRGLIDALLAKQLP